ncbi:MAG: DUF3105 domain-containing protein [Actinomycetota bacterium]|nr:DUF3105 domain-containing protein [Actinomycetota bacterium]
MAKKKAKPRRRSSSGAADHERRQQRLEQRRREKERALEQARRAAARRRAIRAALLAAIFAALVLWFFTRGGAPDSFGGHEVQQLSTDGMNQHTDASVDYETSPPVSGAHAPQAVPCGVYGEPIPDEAQVHNLEHGAVGIQYRPDLDPEEIERIEAIVGEYDSNVFSAPYPGLETPVVVSSWGRLMELDQVDEAAARDYVDAFAGNGPERNQSCDNTQDEPFEP